MREASGRVSLRTVVTLIAAGSLVVPAAVTPSAGEPPWRRETATPAAAHTLAGPASGGSAELGMLEDAVGVPRRHRKRQQRPIRMGTSGGNVADFSLRGQFINCCSGTLGALLRKKNRADDLFMLSNNHVLARLNKAEPGEQVSQPGRIDNRCRAPEANWVGTLAGFKTLRFDGARNTVDAAIAVANRGAVDESGAILGIGIPGNRAIQPRIGMVVQKSGRTTAVTKGRIFAINARVQVRYRDGCGPDAPLVLTSYANQLIIVSPTGEPFTTAGDSGAAILEDVKTCPSYVGLFFAGNSAISVANRMTSVLKAVKKMQPRGTAEFVGCEQPAAVEQAIAAAGPPELREADLRAARRTQARVERAILALDGVHGIGIGGSSGRADVPSFKIFADTTRPELAGRLPDSIEGIGVEIVHSGPIYGNGAACQGPRRRR